MRNSQNPGAEFLLMWPEKRKACEIPYKFQLHWPLILTYIREKTLLLNFGAQSKLGQIDKIKTYTFILFHKATNQKLRTCSKKNPNSFPGHGTIQDLSLTALLFTDLVSFRHPGFLPAPQRFLFLGSSQLLTWEPHSHA